MSALRWDEEVVTRNAEESLLLPPLLQMLRSRRWITQRTTVRTEFAWNGRRVDLATLSVTKRASAFELKIGSFGRALEQAMYNRLSFDRSWVVIDGVPRAENVEHAAVTGVGIIVVADAPRIVLPAQNQVVSRVVRNRLRSQLGGN